MKRGTEIMETLKRTTVPLRAYLESSQHSLLCIGPMSRNTVQAVINVANRNKQPLPLIASRRQIESAQLGGGYVENWSTREFAEFVHARDTHGMVAMCRDHGGPWQGNNETELDRAAAMVNAKMSLLEDISSGFEVVHLDPSVRGGALTDSETLDMLFELYDFVCRTAAQLGVHVEIEVGAEQQSGFYSDPRELVSFIKAINRFCEQHGYNKPLFCVVQTGTLVKEMRNVGFTEGRRNEQFDQKYAVETMEKTVRYLGDIARISGMFVKEHNGDYLSDGSMLARRRLEVGAVNIAPELGVSESKALVSVCMQLGLKRQAGALVETFYNSKKWEKWLSTNTTASHLDRALIAGHYTFASESFKEIKADIDERCAAAGFALEDYLVQTLESTLQRMLWNLGYFHAQFEGRSAASTRRADSSIAERVERQEIPSGESGSVSSEFALSLTGPATEAKPLLS
jgi:hypothetical protein